MSGATRSWYSGLTGGTRNRASEHMISTGGRVALIGLVTALITLGFTIWVQMSLYRQGKLRIPLSQSATHLYAAIDQSMAHLGGWIVEQNDKEWMAARTLWTDRIQPEFATLAKIARKHRDLDLKERIAALGTDLQELERLQWLIADMAHTPGNVPANLAYRQEVSPIGELIDRTIRRFLMNPGLQPETVIRLRTLAAALLRVDRTLLGILVEPTPAKHRQLQLELKHVQQRALDVTEHPPPGDMTEGLLYTVDRLRPYVESAKKVARLRTSPTWNQALRTRSEELLPALARVQNATRQLAETQNTAMIASARQLARWSAVVVLLALLMGILSGGSLYNSLRVAYKMREVLARAKMLGQYAIEARLGAGGMGEVYRARHAMLRRPTAIKLLRPSSAGDFSAQDRFRSEVQLTSQLTHPNTIDIYDYGRTPEGIFYYAMELLEGVDLNTLVQVTGPLSAARTVHILLQVCGSLEEAHAKGLLHRDIKPSNIMLTERGGVFDRVKVLDFGLVRRVGDSMKASSVEGTPMYLAPEVIADAEASSPRSDLYALGGVAYFLITGTSVFEIDDVTELLQAHVETHVQRPSERLGSALPAGLDEIILSCLAKDPQDRPESATHLAALLEECPAGTWSASDARAWWMDYGEALRGALTTADGVASDLASGLRVARTTRSG